MDEKLFSKEEEVFQRGSMAEMRRLASLSALTWKGKKVILDPFIFLELRAVVLPVPDRFYMLEGWVETGSDLEPLFSYDALFNHGAIREQFFRFWRQPLYGKWSKEISSSGQMKLAEMKKWVKKAREEGLPIEWSQEPSAPLPFPILRLTSRSAIFAQLWMEYEGVGDIEVKPSRSPLSSDELSWESELLESGFSRMERGESSYYSPTDKLVQSITYLIKRGWSVLNFEGKRVVLSTVVDWSSEAQPNAILVKGTFQYGEHKVDVGEMFDKVKRNELWIDLHNGEVGLVDAPAHWMRLADEERVEGSILVPNYQIGVLEGILSLPKEYQEARWLPVVPAATFKGTLFDYQQEGLTWLSYLYRSSLSALLSDEMGLGKTIQVIAFLSTLELKKPLLIVMPLSLIFHWKREFEKFLPSLKVYIYQGKKEQFSIDQFEPPIVFLISYAKLWYERETFQSQQFEAIILDEAQAIKNSNTAIAQLLYSLHASFKLAITGTPIENRLEDLISIFRFLIPELKLNQSSAEIRAKIRPFVLRRTREDVALQLPEKVEQVIWLTMDEEERALYDQLIATGYPNHSRKDSMAILKLILKLRQLCSHPLLLFKDYQGKSSKFETVCNDLEEVITSKRKVLLYSSFTSLLQLFREWIERKQYAYAYLDGTTKNRKEEIDRFQNDPEIHVFLISLKAGGVGLNLQAADYVFLYDPWWNRSVEEQAIARAHRVGRLDTVVVRRYLFSQTLEEKISKLQLRKKGVAEEMLNFEEGIRTLTVDELYDLISP